MNKLQNRTVASKSVKSNYGHDPYIIIIIHDKGTKPSLSTKPPCFPFTLKQCENIANSNRSLDISCNLTLCVVHKLNPNLSHLPSRSRPTDHLYHCCFLRSPRIHFTNLIHWQKIIQTVSPFVTKIKMHERGYWRTDMLLPKF